MTAREASTRGSVMTLPSALLALGVVFSFAMPAFGIYGYAPGPLYYAILATYPPLVACLVAIVGLTRGRTRHLFAGALLAFIVMTVISYADYGVTRMHVKALKVISTKPLWDLANFADVAGIYLSLLAATTLAKTPLLKKVGAGLLSIEALLSLGFVFAKWLTPTPPLVPFFHGALFIVAACMLFELGAAEQRSLKAV